jgi:hypothetical protein
MVAADRLRMPPLSVPIAAVAPLRESVPPLMVVSVPGPPSVAEPPLSRYTVAVSEMEVMPPLRVPAMSAFAHTTPPEMSERKSPAALTVPLPMPPPLMVALLPKRVPPAPLKPCRVMVPEEDKKLTALSELFELLTAARLRLVPLIRA